MDNMKTWTGLPVEEPTRMTEDRDKWKRYVKTTDGLDGHHQDMDRTPRGRLDQNDRGQG